MQRTTGFNRASPEKHRRFCFSTAGCVASQLFASVTNRQFNFQNTSAVTKKSEFYVSNSRRPIAGFCQWRKRPWFFARLLEALMLKESHQNISGKTQSCSQQCTTVAMALNNDRKGCNKKKIIHKQPGARQLKKECGKDSSHWVPSGFWAAEHAHDKHVVVLTVGQVSHIRT